MKKIFLCIFITAFIMPGTYSQITITGATCTVPGLSYQYQIVGVDSASILKICVSGGQIVSSTPNCAESLPVNWIKIRWDDSGNDGTIAASSSTGNATLTVNKTFSLVGGIIDSLQVGQFVDAKDVPADLNCTVAAGGNCNPLYQYQWQSSQDNQDWREIGGESGATLHFNAPISTTTYFRRRTLETVSNTIAYSNTALIIVNKGPGQ